MVRRGEQPQADSGDVCEPARSGAIHWTQAEGTNPRSSAKLPLPAYSPADIGCHPAFLASVANDVAAFAGGPWIDLTLPSGWGIWGQVPAILIITFVHDGFYYWHHRLQHRSLSAWATHRLHHLDEDMGVTTGYKHHWTDDALRTVTMFLPIGLLFKFEPVTLWWLSFLFSFHQLFLHANINLSFGKLDYVIMSPALHRVHHSQLK
jgi:sterol desaturase/sphingolipid hydroxylase (fatty acid hydroxylase superfamily)